MRKIVSWLLTGRRPLWAAAVIVVLVALSGRLWTVLKPIVSYATAQPQNATFVAALIALLGILLTQIVNTSLARTGQSTQQELEEQRARAASLQSYLEQMGELLLNHQLRGSALSNESDDLRVAGWGGSPLEGRRIGNTNSEGENSQAIAQAQTLAVLGGLDPTEKRFLVQFLYYSALLNKNKPVISLADADLRKADLSGAILEGINLSGAILSGADLSKADLSKGNLIGTYLFVADLSETNLSGANLSGAFPSGANLREANLTETDLSGTYLIKADLNGANLSGANLREAKLRQAKLEGANLNEANLSKAYLSGANLRRADLSGADLSGAILWGATKWRGAILEGAKLKGFYLTDAIAHLRKAKLEGVIMEGADLTEANLEGFDLRRANLREAKLEGTNLRRANLSGADLSGCKVTKKQLTECALLEGATLPDGSKHD